MARTSRQRDRARDPEASAETTVVAGTHAIPSQKIDPAAAAERQCDTRSPDAAGMDAQLWRSFEHSPVAMCSCDLEGRTLWVNRAFANLVATPRERLLGLPFFDLVDGRDAPAALEAITQLAAGRHDRFHLRARMCAGPGQSPETKLFLSGVRGDDGAVAYIVAQALDVTLQQRTEARLVRRLELEKIAASIGTELIDVPFQLLDGAVVGALAQIAEFVGADSGFVVRISGEKRFDVTHRWHRETEGADADSAAAPAEWLAAVFTDTPAAGIFALDDVEHLVRTRPAVASSLERFGIRALLVVPLRRDERVDGALCFTARRPQRWEPDSVASLRIAARTIFDVIERKASETALRESESRFLQLADSIDQIFWVLQLDPLRMLYVSPTVDRVWGLNSENVMRFAERVVAEDLPAFGEVFSGALSEPREREYRIDRTDGERRWLKTRAFPVRGADGQVYRIAGTTEDITESKRIADELMFRAEMDRLTTHLATNFINVPPERIDDCIDQTVERLGRFSGADVSFVSLLDGTGDTVESTYTWLRETSSVFRDGAIGWSLSTFPWFGARVLGKEHVYAPSIRELPPEAEVDRLACEALGIGSAYAAPMVAAGVLVGWLGFVTRNETRWSADALRLLDVAVEMLTSAIERKRAARELNRYREFERQIAYLSTNFINIPADGLDAGIRNALRELAGVTSDDWAFLYVANAGTTIAVPAYEWSRGGRPASDVLAPVPLGRTEALGRELREHGAVQRTVAAPADPPLSDARELAGLGVAAIVHVALVSKGELFGTLALASSTEKTWPTETIALLRIAADMIANAIERIRTEKQMRRHEAELAHALRLGTMGELAAGLAHELNQPLAAILGFARGCEHRLRNGKIDAPELVATIGKIADQALRAGDVIRTLRAHVRKTEPRREWCEPNELLADVLRLFGDEIARHEVRLVKQLETKLPKVQVDPTQVQQVLLNLLRNAVDAVSDNCEDRRTIVVSTRAAGGGNVEIAVSDTGEGLADDVGERIFEPFYTTKTGGLGLGLSIARSIVEAHRGRLWASRNENGGATFHLTLQSEPI